VISAWVKFVMVSLHGGSGNLPQLAAERFSCLW
jgi:hypothetical protein